MFGSTKPDGYPVTTHLDEMKNKIQKLRLNTVGGLLEELAECRIPLALLIDNGPLIERFIGRKRRRDEEEIYDFMRWLKKTFSKPGLEELELQEKLDDNPNDGDLRGRIQAFEAERQTKLEVCLMPNEALFAAYADVDLDKIEEEKTAVLRFVRNAAEEAQQQHAPIPGLPKDPS